MGEPLVLGVDLGTSAAKAVLADITGRVIGRAIRPQSVDRPGPGLVEQDPSTWWEALIGLVAQLLPDAHSAPIAGISISGHFPTLVLTDASGIPLLPAMLYADIRSDAYVADAVQLTGEPLMGDEIVPKLLWLRAHRADVLSRAAHLFNPQDYLGFRLSGRHAIDHRTAVRTGGLFDLETLSWREEIARVVGIDPRILPDIQPAGSILGAVTAEAARISGIPAGTPVVVGLPDTPAALVGAGVVHRGDVLLYYGTTTTADVCVNDAEMYLRHPALIAQGGFYREVAYAVLGPALSWAASGFSGSDAEVDLAALDAEAAAQPAAREAPFVLPHFMAHPRNDLPARRPAIVGFDLQHRRADLHRALLESFGYTIRAGLEDADMASTPHRFVAAGGGARSRTWRQVVSDVIGADQTWVSGSDEALGDAMIAARAVGADDTFGDGLARWLQDPVVTHARSDAHAIHEERYMKWRSLREAVWESLM